MNKINNLFKKIEYLQWQKEMAKKLIEKTDRQYDLTCDEIAKTYQDFYTNKENKEFILYEDFPSLNALKIYLSKLSDKFPLYEYGNFKVKELAEIIKYLYQFKTDKEYNILTIGAIELHSIPHLYFIVGNNKTLAPFQEYNGKFINSGDMFGEIELHDKSQNIISIDTEYDDVYNTIGIECLTGKITDKPGFLNHFNEYHQKDMAAGFSDNKQIFSNNIRSNLENTDNKMKGIKDVMDFNIHPFDSYIAKVLISIVIYKNNNNIQKLSNNDYNHIFDVLFGENIDIIEETKKDIPRQLVYVPSYQYQINKKK